MADQLKLDVIVDDHGGVQKLADVDSGVKKVATTAQSAQEPLSKLGVVFDANALGLGKYQSVIQTVTPLLSTAGLIAGGVAAGGFIALAGGLDETVTAAVALHRAAEDIGGDASRFSLLAEAGESARVSQEGLVKVIDRLSERIASGKIDTELRLIGVELEHLKTADPSDQLLKVAEAVGSIAEPADRARARLLLLGNDSPEAARLMTTAFKEAADGATGMSKEAIAAFNSIGESWDQLKTKVSAAPSRIFGMAFDEFLRMRREFGTSPDAPPTPPEPPTRQLPAPPTTTAPELAERTLKQLEAQHQLVEDGYRLDEVMRSIAAGQALIIKDAEKWADTNKHRVEASVDAINAKYVQAVMLNAQLASGAQSERDKLMAQLTATTNPNESAYDKRFNQIDQEAKAKLAAVDQSDRVSAAKAENAIYEEMNLKVQELQQTWEQVGKQQDDNKKKTEDLKASYEDLTKVFQPAGGVSLPAGLTAPTAEQLANHRYFGPVTPSGEPDYARMGGAAPISVQVPINAQGAFLNDPQNIQRLVSMVTKGVMEDPTLNRLLGRR